jgi:branched-chain amino acid transport system substrate-binding protein
VSIGAFYGTAQTLFMAIEKAKSYEKTAVRDALRNAEFKGTVMGDMKFDNIGLALFPQTANQWWEGKQMLFYPPVKGGYQLKLAPPWDQR